MNGSSSSGHVGVGGGAEDDGATDSADSFPPGTVAPSPPTTTRSVSATLQYEEEQRPRGLGSRASPRRSNASDSGSHHRNSYPQATGPPPPPPHHQQQQQLPHNARETCLNYFFGQNGPGPLVAVSGGGHAGAGAGAGAVSSADGVMSSGRDVSGAGAVATQRSGLSLAGKLDGNSQLSSD